MFPTVGGSEGSSGPAGRSDVGRSEHGYPWLSMLTRGPCLDTDSKHVRRRLLMLSGFGKFFLVVNPIARPSDRSSLVSHGLGWGVAERVRGWV